MRMRRQFIKKSTTAASLAACERECSESRDFICRSFNYRAVPYGGQRENCELSDRDARDLDMNNPSYFEPVGDFDFYEKSASGRSGQECLDGNSILLVSSTSHSTPHFCIYFKDSYSYVCSS